LIEIQSYSYNREPGASPTLFVLWIDAERRAKGTIETELKDVELPPFESATEDVNSILADRLGQGDSFIPRQPQLWGQEEGT